VFADATVTSAISCFLPGSRPGSMRLRLAAGPATLGALGGGRPVSRAALGAAGRWGPLVRGAAPAQAAARSGAGAAARSGAGAAARPPAGHVELGDICRVHRGQVTGANAVWVRGPEQADVP